MEQKIFVEDGVMFGGLFEARYMAECDNPCWRIRKLPDDPHGKAGVVAQRGTRAEAFDKLWELVYEQEEVMELIANLKEVERRMGCLAYTRGYVAMSERIWKHGAYTDDYIEYMNDDEIVAMLAPDGLNEVERDPFLNGAEDAMYKVMQMMNPENVHNVRLDRRS